jgi:hypothetical protein
MHCFIHARRRGVDMDNAFAVLRLMLGGKPASTPAAANEVVK